MYSRAEKAAPDEPTTGCSGGGDAKDVVDLVDDHIPDGIDEEVLQQASVHHLHLPALKFLKFLIMFGSILNHEGSHVDGRPALLILKSRILIRMFGSILNYKGSHSVLLGGGGASQHSSEKEADNKHRLDHDQRG